MSSSVESRIVSMKFDNRDFERGVSTTLHSLGTLGKALDAGFTSKAVNGLSRVGSAIKGFSFGSMGGAVDGISGKFIALSTIAVTALSRMTNSAIDFGINFAKQFTGIAGAMEGFREYELNINSIQTIIANTGASLPRVTGYLEELNEYSDKTVYNFAQMAENIGRFTAAGVGLRPATDAIKGMANTAALTGANTQQLSSAMYQMSQALSTGVIKLMDWNSLNNANMGTENVRNALMATTRSFGDHGKAMDDAMKKYGSFRDSLQAGWLTAEVFTKTMKVMAGQTVNTAKDVEAAGFTMKEFEKAGLELGDTIAFSTEQLREMGYSAEAAQELHRLSQAAIDSAQDIKTFTQLISVAKETIGSGWSKTWAIVIGDFEEAKALFTGMGDVINGFFEGQAEARNQMLQDWKDAGGRDDLLAGFNNLFRTMVKIIRPIRNAFNSIFPPATGEQLASITEGFRKLTENLIPSRETSRAIKDIFKGIFTVFKIAGVIIGGVIKYVAEFFGIIITGGGGDALGAILGLVAAVGRFVAMIGDWLMEGAKLEKFFDMVIDARNSVLEPLVGTIGAVIEALVALVSGDVSGFFGHLEDAGSSLLDVFGVVGDSIENFIGNISEYSASVANFFSELGSGGFDAISSVFETIGDAIDNVKEKLNFGGVGVSVDAGPLAQVGEGLDQLSWISEAFSAVWETLGTVFGFVGDTIAAVAPRIWKTLGIVGGKVLDFVETMSLQDLIAIINTGVFVMLYRAFTRLADSAGGLLGVGDAAKDAFGQLTNTLKSMQTAVQAQLILSIAIAVGLLAASLIALSFVPADKLQTAGLAIAGMITGLVGAMKILGGGGAGKSVVKDGVTEITSPDLQLGLLSVAAAMIGMATAVLIMAGAMRILDKTNWESFGKLAAILGIMTLSMGIMGRMGASGIGAAAGLAMIGMAAGLTIMAGALRLYDKVKWKSIGKMAAVLLALGLALAGLGLVGPAVLAGAAALLIMAPALSAMVVSLLLMKKVKWETIGKLAVILTALALGLTGMIAALPGAIALGVLAVSLALLMPTLKTLGDMDFKTFLKSVGLLVATMITLGVVGAVLGALSPLIALFGLALMTVGAALVLVGAGTFLFASGLAILAVSGTAAFAVLAAGITSFLILLPQWVLQFKATCDAIIFVLQETGPPLVQALGEIFRALLDEIADSADEWGNALENLIEEGLEVIRNTSDDWIDTAWFLLDELIGSLGNKERMDKLAKKGADAIVNFLQGIQKQDQRIVDEGVRTIISLVGAMGRAVLGFQTMLWAMGWSLISHMVGGLVGAINSLWHNVVSTLESKIGSLSPAARAVLEILSPSRVFYRIGEQVVEGLRVGISDNGDRAAVATEEMGRKAIDTMANTMRALGEVSAEKIEFDPTIRPVLDLTEVEAGAGKIAGLLTSPTLSTGVLTAEARSLATTLAAQTSQNGGDSSGNKGDTTFIQNNYSPKALSPADTYRGTKSLLSLKRKELENTDETD